MSESSRIDGIFINQCATINANNYSTGTSFIKLGDDYQDGRAICNCLPDQLIFKWEAPKSVLNGFYDIHVKAENDVGVYLKVYEDGELRTYDYGVDDADEDGRILITGYEVVRLGFHPNKAYEFAIETGPLISTSNPCILDYIRLFPVSELSPVTYNSGPNLVSVALDRYRVPITITRFESVNPGAVTSYTATVTLDGKTLAFIESVSVTLNGNYGGNVEYEVNIPLEEGLPAANQSTIPVKFYARSGNLPSTINYFVTVHGLINTPYKTYV